MNIIEKEDSYVAKGNGIEVSVPLSGRVFKRKAIFMDFIDTENDKVEWLVCELNGVRLYITEHGCIMTTLDLYPQPAKSGDTPTFDV